MGDSPALSAPSRKTRVEFSLARPLAPEDVRAGDYVAILHVTYELPSFLWCTESFQASREEPVRIQLLADEGGVPLKVRSICLPFVLVKDAEGKPRTLDLRKYRLARLHKDYAKAVWKALRKCRPNSLGNWLSA